MSKLPANPNLTLLLPANKNWDFYVYDFNLVEGISMIPTGVLTLYSRDFMDMEDLNGYLDTLATVKITQKHNEENISRCFSGIITNVVHLGLMQENENGTTYGFRMTIQHAMINLCYARHNYTFKDRTPLEAIQTILEKFTVNMDQLNEDNTPGLNTPSSFYQGKENDFQFLMRILETYGINFCCHSIYTDKFPKTPVTYLNSPGVFSVSAELSPETDLDAPLDFHCRTRNAEHYALTHWEQGNRIGVDAVKVDYQSANSQALSQLSGNSNAQRMFCYNSSQFGMIQQNDIEQKTDSYMGKLNLAKHNWQGTTGALAAMPGVSLNVKEFYGTQKNTTISAVILSANLFCRAPMPDSILQFDDAQPATCQIKIHCIDRNKPTELGAAVTPSQQQNLPQTNSLILGAAGANIDNSNSTSITELDSSNNTVLLQAIVCDATGNTSSSNSLSTLSENNLAENRYTFTAKLLSGNNSSTPVDVWLVMPLGGFGQGLFRVPRQGEYILVAQNTGNNEYYLMGYLPNGNMPFASKANYSAEYDPDTKESKSLNSATVLRFSQTSYNSSVPDYVGDEDAILPKRPGMHSDNIPRYCEIGFYTNYASSNNTKPSSYNAAPETQGEDLAQVNPDTEPNDNSNNDTKTITENLLIQAPNTIDVTSGDSINFNSKSINISGQINGSCENSTLTIGNFKKINISATGTIMFAVGKCTVLIDDDCIMLTAARWSQTVGPFTTSVMLSAMSGAIISGMNTMISGAYSVSISDGSGDSLRMATGVMTQTAAQINQSTQKRLGYGIVNALTGAYAAIELIGFGLGGSGSESANQSNTTLETVSRCIQSAGNLAMQTYGAIMAIKGFKTHYNDELTKDETHIRNLNIAAFVFNLVAAILEQVLGILKATCPDWLSKKAGKVTNRDCFRLTCMSLYTIGWILGVIAGAIIVKTLSNAEVKLSANKIQTEAETIEKSSQTDEQVQSVMSGKQL